MVLITLSVPHVLLLSPTDGRGACLLVITYHNWKAATMQRAKNGGDDRLLSTPLLYFYRQLNSYIYPQ